MEKNNTLKAKKCVTADAGPLIHLDELDIIDLLTKTTATQILESIPHKSTLHLSRTLLFEVIQSVKEYKQTTS